MKESWPHLKVLDTVYGEKQNVEQFLPSTLFYWAVLNSSCLSDILKSMNIAHKRNLIEHVHRSEAGGENT